MLHYSISVPERAPTAPTGTDGSSFDIIVDIEHDRIDLVKGEAGAVISLDLICAAELEKTLRRAVGDRDFQAALNDTASGTAHDLDEFQKHCLWAMGYDPDTGTVTILPMNGDGSITIRSAEEARFFTDLLMDHYRRR